MDSQQGSGFRQGFEEADTETVEARVRRDADAVADDLVSDRLTSGAGSAGGADLAHDFSNLAMSVISAANLLQRCGDDPARVAEIAGLLRETGERAVAMSRKFRAPMRPRGVLLVEEDSSARKGVLDVSKSGA